MRYVPLPFHPSLTSAYPALVHRWLFDVPGILHRDLSPHNIMWRLVMEMNARGEQEQKVYGVLTDYDLSSWKKHLPNGYTMTSRQRTGTPPYMAQELLQGTSDTNLYRHDVESLFYIMLLLGARHTIRPAKGGPDVGKEIRVVMREGAHPYQEWFNTQKYRILGLIKEGFFLRLGPIELSPAFEDFRPWLHRLRHNFSRGFHKLQYHKIEEDTLLLEAGGSVGGLAPTSTPFDNETLGGHVDYSIIVESTRNLKGQLEGLIVRYNPTPPPLLSPIGAVQADS